MEHVEKVTVAAPAGHLWSALVDVESWPRWTESMTDVRVAGGGPLVVGSTVAIRQPGLRAATWTVTELEPGHAFTWCSATPGLRTVAVHAVEATPEGSSLTLTVRQSGALSPLVAALLGAKVRRFMALEARGLARAATQTP
ncbi:MAG: SRPBCC family protein [Actinomycetota bacterium]